MRGLRPVIMLFAVLLGFCQEFRAERAVDTLRQMAAPGATVARDGSKIIWLARSDLYCRTLANAGA